MHSAQRIDHRDCPETGYASYQPGITNRQSKMVGGETPLFTPKTPLSPVFSFSPFLLSPFPPFPKIYNILQIIIICSFCYQGMDIL